MASLVKLLLVDGNRRGFHRGWDSQLFWPLVERATTYMRSGSHRRAAEFASKLKWRSHLAVHLLTAQRNSVSSRIASLSNQHTFWTRHNCSNRRNNVTTISSSKNAITKQYWMTSVNCWFYEVLGPNQSSHPAASSRITKMNLVDLVSQNEIEWKCFFSGSVDKWW